MEADRKQDACRAPGVCLARQIFSGAVLILMIGSFTGLFSDLAAARYQSFQSLWPRDFAIFTQALYHALTGRGFTHTVLQDGSLFGFRAFYILYFYRLVLPMLPGSLPERMVGVQCALIALGAVPVYLLTWRRTRSLILSLMTAALYLSYGLVQAIALADFNPQTLLIPLLLTVFFFFESGRRVFFILTAILTLAVKDHAFAYLFLLSAYAFIKRRGMFWTVAPAVLAAGYVVLHMTIVPGSLFGDLLFGTGTSTWREAVRLRVLGHSLGEIARGLSLPFALALAAPLELALALPSMIKSLATLWVGPRDVYVYYWSETAAFIFVAIPFALSRLIGAFGERRIIFNGRQWATLMLSAMLVFQVVETRNLAVKARQDFRVSEKAAAAWQFAQVIPQDAVAGADSRFLAGLAERDRLYEFDDKDRGALWDVPGAWLLIDAKEPRPLYGMEYWRRMIEEVEGRADWEVVMRGEGAADGLLLLHRAR